MEVLVFGGDVGSESVTFTAMTGKKHSQRSCRCNSPSLLSAEEPEIIATVDRPRTGGGQ
jgi:hypothetical protein